MGSGALLEIAQYNKKSTLKPGQIAFRAESKEQVNAIYEAALKAGARCNGQPGPHNTQTIIMLHLLSTQVATILKPFSILIFKF